MACFPFPPWNLLSFTVKSTLASSCSRSDPLSLSKVRLWLTLTLPFLTIWCYGQTALFLLAKTALAYLATALCGSEVALSFSASPVCSSFSAEACACSLLVSAAPTSLPLLFYLTLVLSSPLCFLLHLFFYLNLSGRNCLLFPLVLSGYPHTRLSRGMTRLMSWPDGERYSCPLQSLVVSLLLLLVSTLFSEWRRTVSSNSWTPRFLRFPLMNLCSLGHARCVLSRFRCNGHSLLLDSSLSRIGRIENPSCSAGRHSSQDTSYLILHCPATDSLRGSLFGDSLSPNDPKASTISLGNS